MPFSSTLSAAHPIPALFVGFVGSSRGNSWHFLIFMLVSFPFVMLFVSSSGSSNPRRKQLTRGIAKLGFTKSETNLLACFPYTMSGTELPLAVSGTRGGTDLIIIDAPDVHGIVSSTVALRGLDTARFLVSIGNRSQKTSTIKDWLVYTPGDLITLPQVEALIDAIPANA